MPARVRFARQQNRGSLKTGDPVPPRSWFERINAYIFYFKGAPAFGLIVTALFAYFQYLSNYENKVREISKDDLAAATSVFLELSNKLASAMTLQQMLYFTFSTTQGKKPEETSLQTRTAPEIYKTYSAARTELRQNISVYARRAEIFMDWPSDLDRDPAKEKNLPSDPITKSGIGEQKVQQTAAGHQDSGGADMVNLIGTYNFDCDQMFPVSHDLSYLGELTLPRPGSLTNSAYLPEQIVVNWGSLKHQLVTLQYCFERIHDKLKRTREWAYLIDTPDKIKPDFHESELIREKLDNQVARFNFFVALAMRRIQDIRIKYRPNGFLCYVPGIREFTDMLKHFNLIKRGCSSIHYAGPRATNQPS